MRDLKPVFVVVAGFLVMASQFVSAQERTAATDAGDAQPATCALETCEPLIEAVGVGLEASGFEVMGLRLAVDGELGLVAEADVTSCEPDTEALKAENSTNISSATGGSGGADKVKFDKLTCTKHSERSSAGVLVVPVTFPEGLTVVMPDGSITQTQDFTDIAAPPEEAACWWRGNPKGCINDHQVQQPAGEAEYGCWWVDGELVCWTPA